ARGGKFSTIATPRRAAGLDLRVCLDYRVVNAAQGKFGHRTLRTCVAPTSSDAVALPRPTQIRYLVIVALCTAAVIAYIHRSCLAVPATLIRSDLYLSAEDMEI